MSRFCSNGGQRVIYIYRNGSDNLDSNIKRLKEELFSFIPSRISYVLNKVIDEKSWDKLEEIRIFKKGSIVVCIDNIKKYITSDMELSNEGQAYIADDKVPEDVIKILTGCCEYAYENQIKSGYLTAPGGHRVGLVGTGVMHGAKISSIKDISAINIRVAREAKGSLDSTLRNILHGKLSNIMIVSPPKCGKTTLLRLLAKEISSDKRLSSVCVIDERGEICSCNKGMPHYNMGPNTSVVSGIPKEEAMTMVLKSMAPDIIICDEITTSNEAESLMNTILSGVKVIFTVHGQDCGVLKQKKIFSCLNNYVEYIIELSSRCGPGTVEKVEVL